MTKNKKKHVAKVAKKKKFVGELHPNFPNPDPLDDFKSHPLDRADDVLNKALAELGMKLDEKLHEFSRMKDQLHTTVEVMNDFAKALADFRDHGGRFDPTPTTILSPGGPAIADADGKPYAYSFRQVQEFTTTIHRFYQEYLKRIDESIRDRARIALGEDPLHQPKPGTVVVARQLDAPPDYQRIVDVLVGKSIFMTGHEAIELSQKIRAARGGEPLPADPDILYELIKPHLK